MKPLALSLPLKLRLAASFAVGLLVIALMAGVLALAFGLLTPLKKTAERQLSAALGTGVRIGTFMVKDSGKIVEMTDIVIANPPGFEGPYALRAGFAVARIESVSPGLLALDTLTLSGLDVSLAFSASGANLVTLAENTDPVAAVKYRAKPGGPPLKITVRTLNIEGITVSGQGQLPAAVPGIAQTNIGTAEGGVLASQAVSQLTGTLARHALLAAISLRRTADAPQGAITAIGRFLVPPPTQAERLRELSKRFVERFDAFSYFYPAINSKNPGQ